MKRFWKYSFFLISIEDSEIQCYLNEELSHGQCTEGFMKIKLKIDSYKMDGDLKNKIKIGKINATLNILNLPCASYAVGKKNRL